MVFGFLKKLIGTAQERTLKNYRKSVEEVNRFDELYNSLSDEALRNKTEEFRKRLKNGESLDQLLPEAFGVVKNVCRRLIGTEVHVSGYDQEWDMIPFDVQILGAIALHFGSIAEMQTGEGKTLTAVMPLYLNALAGKPVHLVTVNDYLAKRDCEWVGTILRWLNLTTGPLTNDAPMEERKKLYQVDVLYGTASEFGFDYLRDNSMAITKEDQVQRDYYYAIIDEIDCILIDEARTPLIISGPSPESYQMYEELKSGVAELVRRQRDFCNKLASEAKRALDLSDRTEARAKDLSKEEKERENEALRKLWLISKGTPQNKILKRVRENPDMRARIDEWDLYYYSDVNKQEKAQALAELLIIIDEKSQEFELTDKGIDVWEECTEGSGHRDDFVMFDISEEFLKIDEDPTLDKEAKISRKLAIQEEDRKRKERAHNLRQLLRAHLLMEKDIDYIVQENKIIIIDENTGRPQPGRRFSDGLHQAIEAKEGVSIQKETQTYATITLQNFFRKYEKLAGMTGTAITEANEFKQIYKIDVLQIPTNKPCIRYDFNDEIYMTEREKYQAILKWIKDVHGKGRPILLGSDSVEVSEKLSRILKQNNLVHTVLNAKYHEKEAEIIAHAGKTEAITIATNMAGRGTDIKLEKGIAERGGLHVIGSTRHQSRRIDRQLRGRSARQGDPGSSKFFISFEDSLLRLFASPRMTAILQRFRPPEGEAISARILNRSIETAQKRVEQRNYVIRKHTLEYDDVMNIQREEIYAFRNEILSTEQIPTLAFELLSNVCEEGAEQFFINRGEERGWDPEGYRQWLMNQFPITFEEGEFDDDHSERTELAQKATKKLIETLEEKLQREDDKLKDHIISSQVRPSHSALRQLMIQNLDHLWQEHLLSMDHLRQDVHLRSFGQKDPLMEFKHEGFRTFHQFRQDLYLKMTRDFFRFEIAPRPYPMAEELFSKLQMETDRSFFAELQGEKKAPSSTANHETLPSPKLEPYVTTFKPKRNDPCPCGSGKKYKKCCGAHKEPTTSNL